MLGLRLIPKSAYKDNALDANGGCRPTELLRQVSISRAEVAPLEGMHEVVGGSTTTERQPDRVLVADIDPVTYCARYPRWAASKRHRLMPTFEQCRHQGTPDKARRTYNRYPHVTSMVAGRPGSNTLSNCPANPMADSRFPSPRVPHASTHRSTKRQSRVGLGGSGLARSCRW